MPRFVCVFALVVGLFVAACVSAVAVSNVAYETDDGIVLKLGGRETVFAGQAPEFSPDGNRLGLFRQGNIYILDMRTHKFERVTNHPAQQPLEWAFRLRLRWNPSGDVIAYTRVEPYEYIPGRQVMVPAKAVKEDDDSTRALSTIWVVNLKTGENWRAVNLRGNFPEMMRTCQLEGASVYEPFFSPDGKHLGFANAGSLFEQPFAYKKPDVAPKVRVVAWMGYLDFFSPGASKSGEGVYEVAWDAKHQRLCCWLERFWGSGSSNYAYLPWSHGRWGAPRKWKPAFGGSIDLSNSYFWNMAIDRQGRLWCYVASSAGSRWKRFDGRDSLPEGADSPTFR